MTKDTVKIRPGNLLLAEPFLNDPFFRRAVVLLCEHHVAGSAGFMLNKPIDMKINEITDDFPYIEADVYYGGPVQTQYLNWLHNKGHLLTNSVKITENIWWGGHFDELKEAIQTGQIRQEDIRFFVGYTGWGQGQLAEEMEVGTWVPAPMQPAYMFKSKPTELWNEVMYSKGDKFEIISHIPETMSWN